jgi:protein required for attachment to host cells
MILSHKTEVCVADGRKLLLLVNDGDAKFPDLRVIREDEYEAERNRDISSSPPGRVFQSGDARRSSYEEADFKQLAEDQFAADAAEILNKRALANSFDKLIIVAPPKTLGEMRQHYHKVLAGRIVGEIAKEATNRPPDWIASMIADA